jgi:two-component system, cell cycle response regulator CpdR
MASPMKVLYIEDNALVRELTVELLADGKRQVTAVATAEEALSVDPHRFDLVITDVSLPGMSGVDLARRLQGIDASLPIILVSGYRLDTEEFRLGPNIRAITKPFGSPELEALIQELSPALKRRSAPES